MIIILSYLKYELLPEYNEKSQLTDLFVEHKLWFWLGLFNDILSYMYGINLPIKNIGRRGQKNWKGN